VDSQFVILVNCIRISGLKIQQ